MTDSVPIHLHPTAPLADRVLLPGDPGRALLLAQALLTKPAMFNHNRGLWGYSGTTGEGLELTIQSTGMGGPSAAIVISELADLGARALVRVGTCGALDPSLGLGELLIVTEALPADGTSRALGAEGPLGPDGSLRDALVAAEPQVRAGSIVSTDLFYDERLGIEEEWWAAGALAVEMESATLFSLAATRGLAAASVLLVSDLVHPERKRISADRLRAREPALGELGVRGLAGR